MNGRTTSIVALLTLLLGSGVGYVKFVSPALAERTKLEGENRNLNSQTTQLNNDIAELKNSLNNLAMSTISYFDLTGVPNKRRIMEAKTVETLSSLTEILNDNHIRIVALDPKGESTALNKPVPTPAAPSLKPGETPPPQAAAAPTPTPQPGATTPPPPIQLTHKLFSLQLQGEYADFVKALREIQGLPRAISVNSFDLNLVRDNSVKGKVKSATALKNAINDSPTLLAMDCDMSITFLMDTAGVVNPGAPKPASPLPSQHAEGLLSWFGDLVCAPAAAAEMPVSHPRTRALRPQHAVAPIAAVPRPAVRPPNALTEVIWADGALRLKTQLGTTPSYKVVGARPGYLVVEFARTVTRGAVFFHPHGPGVKQILAMAAPHDPLATHLVIMADPTTRLMLASTPDRQLRILVEGAATAPAVAAAPGSAIAPLRPAQLQTAGAKPIPAPATVAGRPVVAVPSAAPRPILAVLPPHRAATFGPVAPRGAKPGSATAHAAAPAHADGIGTMKIIVTPEKSSQSGLLTTQPALEPDRDRISSEVVRAWEQGQLAELHATPGALPTVPPAPEADSLSPPHAAAESTALPPEPPTAPAAPVPTQAAPMQVAVKPVQARPTAPQAVPARLNAFSRPQTQATRRVARPLVPAAPVTPVSGDELTRLEGARVDGDELVIATHGAVPAFRVIGGNRHLLLLAVEHMPMRAQGQLLTVGRGGVKQVRAALYDNRTYITHLAIDTDGSVRLLPEAGPDGIHLRMVPMSAHQTQHQAVEPRGVSVTADLSTSAITQTQDAMPIQQAPAARPAPVKAALHPHALKPAPHVLAHPRPVTRQALAAPKPIPQSYSAPATVPGATPTPMAVPRMAAGTPATRTGGPAGKPANWPTPAPVPHTSVSFDGRHLETPSSSSVYRFPIDRDRMTGRSNPFRPLANPLATPVPGSVPVAPGGKQAPGVVPAPPVSGGSAPGLTYNLKAIMTGGGTPPTALVSVGGRTLLVGLNQALPGNARVKSIKTDYVILSANGHDIRLNLKR